MTRTRMLAAPGYVLIAATVLAITTWMVRTPYFPSHAGVLAPAVAADICVLLPALYWLIARAVGWPRLGVIPVALLSLLAAHVVLPAGHREVLRPIELLAIPLELVVVVMVLRKAITWGRSTHARASWASRAGILEGIEAALADGGMPLRFARVVASEAGVIYYGALAWFAPREAAEGTAPFSYHVRNGHATIALGFMVVITIETVLLHLALVSRAPLAAWGLTIASAYGALFLLADFGAARARPMLVDQALVHLRAGLRWRCEIPLTSIARVEVTSKDVEGEHLDLKIWGGHNMVLDLSEPVVAHGLYGITKRCRRIALAVDDPRGLARAIEARLNGPASGTAATSETP